MAMAMIVHVCRCDLGVQWNLGLSEGKNINQRNYTAASKSPGLLQEGRYDHQ